MSKADIYMLIEASVILTFVGYMYWRSTRPRKKFYYLIMLLKWLWLGSLPVICRLYDLFCAYIYIISWWYLVFPHLCNFIYFKPCHIGKLGFNELLSIVRRCSFDNQWIIFNFFFSISKGDDMEINFVLGFPIFHVTHLSARLDVQ